MKLIFVFKVVYPSKTKHALSVNTLLRGKEHHHVQDSKKKWPGQKRYRQGHFSGFQLHVR
jgi:hypothetical protein